jgi:hypothetical protein
LQQFPNNADTLDLSRGTAQLIKKDIFKNLMWYVLPDSNKQYPVPIERVKEIRMMNMKGQRPDELGAIELSPAKAEEEHAHVELVGQISLRTLERDSRRRKDKAQGQQRQQQQRQGGQGQQEQRKPQPNRPQQGQAGGQQNKQGGQGQQRPPQQKQQQQRPPQQQRGPQQQRPPQQNKPQQPQQNRPQIEKKKDPPPTTDN